MNRIKSLQAKLRRETVPRKRIYLLLSLADSFRIINTEKGIEYSSQAIKESKNLVDKVLHAESLLMKARILLDKGNYIQSQQCSKKALTILKNTNDNDAILEAEYQLIIAYFPTGAIKQVLTELQRILEHRMNFDRIDISRTWEERIQNIIPSEKGRHSNQQIKIGLLKNAIARAFSELGNDHKALNFLQDELRIWRDIKKQEYEALTLNNLGAIYSSLHKYALALQYFSRALKLNRAFGLHSAIATNLYNMANVYLETGQVKLGKKLARQVYRYNLDAGKNEVAARILIMLAEYEYLHGSVSKAKKLNTEVLYLIKGLGRGESFYNARLQQLLIEQKLKPSSKIFFKLTQLYNELVRKDIELQYETAQEISKTAQYLNMYDESIKWIKKVHENEIRKIQTEKKNIVETFEITLELENLAKERELYILEASQLQNNLKAKEKETEILAIQLAKKGSFLASLTNHLALLNKESGKHSADTINKVIEYINSVRFKDNEFEKLEERASKLHSDFVMNLLNRYPALTETERKICLLFRLGLSTRDIANVLYTSVRTVETHCLNIRKKLKIPPNTRVAAFLRNFKTR